MSYVNLYIIKVWTSKGMMKYDGGKVRVGRQKGLFVAGGGGHHKVSDSLQPEKKKEFQNPAHLILKWNGLGMDSFFLK